MSFLWPNMLWLLFLMPVFVLIYYFIQRRKQKYALRFSSISLIKEAMGRGPGFRRHIPPLLFLIALGILITGLARPMATVTLPSQEGTVILTFDVSGSMRAEDIKPSRIEAAKAAATTFVKKQPNNVRIGVVSFSESASLVQAPTKDREAVLAAINRLNPQRRTAIGSGMLTSLNAIFEGTIPAPAPGPDDLLGNSESTPILPAVEPGSYTSAVIVLLSDGQSNTGPRPVDVVQQIEDRGVRVYTVGLGSPDGTVLRTEGFSIRVRLDEDTLKRIALLTGGQYFRAESETDLSNVYEDLSKKLVFKAEQTEITVAFAASAAALMICAGLLSLIWFQRLT